MARYRDSKCRQCRREGEKLFLKGDRCYSEKCAIERREYPPGQHGQQRRKETEYAVQLRAKQMLKRVYGVLEAQFRRYFQEADRRKGITGEQLIQLLESRLDNLVYRAGFAVSRSAARQLISHRHILVNGKIVNIPAYLSRVGDEISIREKSRKVPQINSALASVDRRGVPYWLELQKENFSFAFKQVPNREDITMPINEQLVVELYSK